MTNLETKRLWTLYCSCTAACCQVMLAQQRTIVQLVELVNALHEEAAKVVASLMPQQKDGWATQPQEEQAAVQQQLQQERYHLFYS